MTVIFPASARSIVRTVPVAVADGLSAIRTAKTAPAAMLTTPPKTADNAPCHPAHTPAITANASVAMACQTATRRIGKPGERFGREVNTNAAANVWIIGFFAATRQRMLRCRIAYAERSTTRQCADDHDFVRVVQRRLQIRRLCAVDEKFNVPANIALLVDHAKAQPRISPIQIRENARERCTVGRNDRGVRGVAAQRSGNQHPYGTRVHAASTE